MDILQYDLAFDRIIVLVWVYISYNDMIEIMVDC